MDSDLTKKLKSDLNNILDLIKKDLSTIRTGRAAPSLVENIVISAYQGSARLRVLELATISAPDTQTVMITPFDTSTLAEIEKGITEANIGLNPVVDGQIIRITIPPLSTERRDELVKSMKNKIENGKIMVRQARHDVLNNAKRLHESKEISDDELQRYQKEIQSIVDDVVVNIEQMAKNKEEELHQI